MVLGSRRRRPGKSTGGARVMRWIGDRESENIEDRRGSGMPMAVGGIGGIGAIIVIVVGLFLGIDPSTLMALLNGDQLPQQQAETRSGDTGGAGFGGRVGASLAPAAPADEGA